MQLRWVLRCYVPRSWWWETPAEESFNLSFILTLLARPTIWPRGMRNEAGIRQSCVPVPFEFQHISWRNISILRRFAPHLNPCRICIVDVRCLNQLNKALSIRQQVIGYHCIWWPGKKWMGCKQLEKFGPSAPLPAAGRSAGTVMVTRERGIVTQPTIRQLLVSTRAANETLRNCTLFKAALTLDS